MTYKKVFISLCLIAGSLKVAAQAPDWENESIFGINKEATHVIYTPYSNTEQALRDIPSASPYYLTLNGAWKFHWVKQPSDRPLNFFSLAFDDSGWKTIPVPCNMEMQGYGTPIYTNLDRKSTRLNSSHCVTSRMPSSA